MKLFKSIISMVVAGCLAAGVTGCADDLVKDNTDPSQLTVATPSQLLLSAEWQLSPYGYGAWFFNAAPILYVNQMSVARGGITRDRLLIGGNRPGLETINQLRYVRAMEHEFSIMGEEQAAQYAAYYQAAKVLTIYMGIYDTDNCGEVPYTEAALGAYEGTLTPAYETVQSLYEKWDNELQEAINVFLNPPTVTGGYEVNQDVIYRCDWAKWAKLANSIRVKLATRWMHKDMTKAKSIVSAAYSSPAGLIVENADNFLYHKADAAVKGDGGFNTGDVAYGTTNGTISYNGIGASEQVVNYMVDNGDPRVRFIFTKNDWNSKVVDFYLQNGFINQIPSVVLDKVNYEVTGQIEKKVKVKDEDEESTIKVDVAKFVSWKGKGEPWVRFIGIPNAFVYDGDQTKKDSYLRQFFHAGSAAEYERDKNGELEMVGGNQINAFDNNWAYTPYCMFQEEHIQGRLDFTLPQAPQENVTAIRDIDDNARYDMYIAAAEINFYLAEFATLGTPGLPSADASFSKAVRQSVEVWDQLAKLNKIPYYHSTYGYDPNEESIALKNGEIDELLANPNYQLSGDKDSDLEKIYLNLEFHFLFNPIDQLVTGRRSGIPKFNSTLFPRKNYAENDADVTMMPRRTALGAISITSIIAPQLQESYKRQGFQTVGDNPAEGYLNKQRVWQDEGAPQWGAGPNY